MPQTTLPVGLPSCTSSCLLDEVVWPLWQELPHHLFTACWFSFAWWMTWHTVGKACWYLLCKWLWYQAAKGKVTISQFWLRILTSGFQVWKLVIYEIWKSINGLPFPLTRMDSLRYPHSLLPLQGNDALAERAQYPFPTTTVRRHLLQQILCSSALATRFWTTGVIGWAVFVLSWGILIYLSLLPAAMNNCVASKQTVLRSRMTLFHILDEQWVFPS